MIIGVDPGQVTGLAWWNEVEQRMELTAQQPAQAAVVTVWEWLEERATSVEVACERYDLTSQTLRATRQYDALEVTGAIRFKCTQLHVPFRQYSRSDAKNFVTDLKLQRLGVYRPGRGHVNDAERQVFTHLATTRPGVFQQLLLDAEHRHG